MSLPLSPPPRTTFSRWPHRLAWALACAVFPLIWLGALVTTCDAGMSIPDWPTTYGHWLYPIHRWLWGYWDIFLEHGHRMWAQLVGLIAIVLAVVLWTLDGRKWMRPLAVLVVVGVVAQGTLGGLRVTAGQRLLAMVHGCTAPAFFALYAAIVALTSPRWQRGDQPAPCATAPRLHFLTTALAAALYAEIVSGAQLRHLFFDSPPGWFLLWVRVELILAGLIALGIGWLVIDVRRSAGGVPMVVRRAWWLAGLFALQVLLGAATWVTNYGFPAWFQQYVWAMGYTVAQGGRWQVNLTTAHVAVGSLTLVAALSLTLWSRRLLRGMP